MENKNYWRGVEGVEILWHGEWADPDLRYGNIVANSFAVEDDLCSLWEMEEEKYPDFSLWCQEHRTDVIETIYLNQSYDNKRFNFFDALDGGTITYADPILIDGMFVIGVRLNDECRMWIRTIDNEEHELKKTSMFDKWSREFVYHYGDFETEATLIDAHYEQVYWEWRRSAV